MSMIDSILIELEQETGTTRRLLERLPADKLGWKPHRKSFSLGQLALHIASIAPAIARMATQDVFEFPTSFDQAEPASKAEVLEALDQGLAGAQATLSGLGDERLLANWTLTKDGRVLLALPRAALLRTFMLNQHYHHRGQLTVYLRELEVPLPPVYGPTADEAQFA